MNKYHQEQLLEVLSLTLAEFQKDGAEVSLVYKDGCIVAEVRTEICKKCKHIHDGPCPITPGRVSAWE